MCDNPIIEMFNNRINKAFIPVPEIREIARSEPWRSMWLAQKGDSLGIRSVEWTETQRLLVSFSRMYDNVYESTECPSDKVIADDDMLDGWFIKQKKDRDEAKQEKSTDHHFGNHKGRGRQELFVMANNQDEVNSILNQNDMSGKKIIESRRQVIEHAGEEGVKEQHMPDVRRDLQMQAVQEMREKIRR